MAKQSMISIKKIITPNRLIYDNQLFDITSIDSDYVITEFRIFLEKEKIQKVLINSLHPNCESETQEFCLPSSIKEANFMDNSKIIIKQLEVLLKTFNFKNCYFTPWEVFSYNKGE